MLYESFESVLDRCKKNNAIEKIICFILCFIFAVVVLANLIPTMDVTPATFDDYAPLNEVLVEVQSSPDVILTQNGNITVSDDTITYTIANDQCELTGIYTKDYQLISRMQRDKSFSVFLAFLVGFMIFAVALMFPYLIIMLITYIIWFMVLLIISCIKKIKSKKVINSIN